jgi:hypothetical protein
MSIEYNSKFFTQIYKSITSEYEVEFDKKYFLQVCQKVCKEFESEPEQKSGCQWTLTRGKVGQLCGVKTKDGNEFCSRHQKCKKDVVEKKEAAEGCQHINERGVNKGNPCSKKCVENSNYCKVHESKHQNETDAEFESKKSSDEEQDEKETKPKKSKSKKSSKSDEEQDEKETKPKKSKSKKSSKSDEEQDEKETKPKKSKSKKSSKSSDEEQDEKETKPKKTKKTKSSKSDEEQDEKEKPTKSSEFDFKTKAPVPIDDQANKDFWKSFSYSSKDLPKNLVYNSKTCLLLIKNQDHFNLYGILVKGGFVKKLESGELSDDVINWCAQSNIII